MESIFRRIGLTTGSGEIPTVFKKFLSNVQVQLQGDTIILKSNDVPPHPSPYFPRGDSLY